jgi:hypothetical protein
MRPDQLLPCLDMMVDHPHRNATPRRLAAHVRVRPYGLGGDRLVATKGSCRRRYRVHSLAAMAEIQSDGRVDEKWLHAELVRIEDHWTKQVQNQQQRISTLLTVTGILLAFLAGAGFLTNELAGARLRSWACVYISSLVSLCLALLMGIWALKPTIPIKESVPLWLNAETIWDRYGDPQFLRHLCESIVKNQQDAKHADVLEGRRAFMYRQLLFLMLSLVLLVVALVDFLFEYWGHSAAAMLRL